jgi:hypothetical protein
MQKQHFVVKSIFEARKTYICSPAETMVGSDDIYFFPINADRKDRANDYKAPKVDHKTSTNKSVFFPIMWSLKKVLFRLGLIEYQKYNSFV